MVLILLALRADADVVPLEIREAERCTGGCEQIHIVESREEKRLGRIEVSIQIEGLRCDHGAVLYADDRFSSREGDSMEALGEFD